MNELLKYFLESSIIFAVFYAIYYFWFINDKNYRFSRLYLLLSSFMAIILPVIQVPVFINGSLENIFTLQEAVQLPEVIVTSETDSSAAIGLEISWINIILAVYLIGLIYFLSRIIIENIYLIGFILKNRQNIIIKENYKLIHTGGKIPTSSWFNYIFWNDTEKLTQKEEEQILRHEEAHIHKKHSLDVLYIELLRAILWPNPFIHGYKLAITALHEWQADDYVVKQSNVSDYIQLLAQQILRSFNFQMSNHFSKSKTIRRIDMIKSDKRRSVFSKTILSLSVSVFLFSVFSCHIIETEDLKSSTTANSGEFNDPIPNPLHQPDPDEEDGEVFKIVEDQPVPKGGMQEFYKYVQDNLIYPESAKEDGIEGKVFVEFIVRKDGNIDNVKILKGIDPACDNIAKEIMENSPDWIPGYQKGKAVDVRMILPFSFMLDENNNTEENEKNEKEIKN